MDCDSEDDQPEKPIEVNVKIPIAMQPRTLRRPTPTGMIGPKRVPIGKFTTVKANALGSRKSSPEEGAKGTKKEKIKMNTEPIGEDGN